MVRNGTWQLNFKFQTETFSVQKKKQKHFLTTYRMRPEWEEEGIFPILKEEVRRALVSDMFLMTLTDPLN